MTRILALLALATLAGCVTTPDYRYVSGQDYYYGDREGYYPDDGYYYDDEAYPLGGNYLGDYYYGTGYGGNWNFSFAATYCGYHAYADWGWAGAYCTPASYAGSYWGFRPWGGWWWNDPWNGYWLGWHQPYYFQPYFWVVDYDRPPTRDLEDLYAEKARQGLIGGGAVSAAAVGASRSSSVRRQAVRREVVRRERSRGEVWHRPWPTPRGSGTVERAIPRPRSLPTPRAADDVGRRRLTRDVVRPAIPRPETVERSVERPVVERRAIRTPRFDPTPTVQRMPAAPTRSVRPAAVRRAPSPVVSRSVPRPTRSVRSHAPTVQRATPRGSPRSSARDHDDD